MGVACNSIQNISLNNEKEELLNDFKERLVSISDDQYVSTCCRLIPEFQEIDCKNRNIVLYCPEHGRKTIEIKDYFEKMNENIYNIKCENEICKKTMKNSKKIFYHCFEDGKNYCSKHLPKNSNSRQNCIPIKEEQNKCILHPDDNLNFCITCNKNICSQIGKHKEDDYQYHFHKKNHKIIERNYYKPKSDDLTLIYLFQKLISLIINTYEKYPKNYFHCVNITNLANFLKGNNILQPNDENIEKKLNDLLDSIETNKKRITLFNLLFKCNISEKDEKINLKDNKIGDLGLNVLCKLELKKLKKLILSNNDISNIENLKELKSNDLEILNLGYNNIRNINVFKEVPFSLKELDLNNNRIENINIFENLNDSKLENLKKLKLNNNNFDCEKNKKIMKSIEKSMKTKYHDSKFNAEINNNFSELIKQWDVFNNKYNSNIKLNDKKIDLSSINIDDSIKILEKLKHQNVEEIIVNKSENLTESILSNKYIMNNYSKLNSINYKDGSNYYLKNQNITDIKFQSNILNLKFIKKIGGAATSYLSENTFVVFNSIVNNKTYIIYYQIDKDQTTILKLKYHFDKDEPDYKILLKFEKGIKIYQIKYYIDVHHQKDIIICSTNNSKIILWEFIGKELKEIRTIINSKENENEISNICVISDIKYNENYIITGGYNGNIRILNEKGKEINYINQQQNIFFIDFYNHYDLSKYYIIIGIESGFSSFEFEPQNNNEIKFLNYKNSINGENKSAIIFSKDSETFLIGCDWKNGFISIFNFDVRLKLKEIIIEQNYLSYGLNLWNDEYLIISCRDKGNNKSKDESSIKIFDLDDEDYNIKPVLNIPAHQIGVLSTIKFKDDNSIECLMSKGLDGSIVLWNCKDDNK